MSMTDNEIIKALECCANEDTDCEDCPVYKYCDDNAFGMVQNTFDLINRQKAEIEKLERIEAIGTKTIETQNAEIERLQEEYKAQHKEFVKKLGDVHSIAKDLDEHTAKAKSEAIKEFAERLRKKFAEPYEYGIGYVIGSIDNLVKEMTEQ